MRKIISIQNKEWNIYSIKSGHYINHHFYKPIDMPKKNYPPAPEEVPNPAPVPEIKPGTVPETEPVPDEPTIEIPDEDPTPDIPVEVPGNPASNIL